MFNGIYSVILTVPDLVKATSWYSAVLDISPYVSESDYTGFNIGGCELGLMSGDHTDEQVVLPVIYFLVDDIQEMCDRISDLGGRILEPVLHIGGAVYTSIISDPFGNRLGLMQNPNYDPVRGKRA